MTTITRCLLFGLLVLALSNSAIAQPPAPKWVQMFDQGEVDPKLKGLRTPRGIKVEVVVEGLRFGAPYNLAFDSQGTLWFVRHAVDPQLSGERLELVAARDDDGDGSYSPAEVVMRDAPHARVLVHDGWFYFVTSQEVLRRRRHEPMLAEKLQTDAAAGHGPPTIVTPDKQWLQQKLVSGLSAKAGNQAGGLAVGLDGWLYHSVGGLGVLLEGWDGSKSEVLGCGVIFRYRPDGSRVQEFARGFANPAGPPASDALGVIFQADRLPGGSRLIQVLEGGDYGWRADLDPPQLGRPGTLPAMFTSTAGNLSGAHVYLGNAFPKFIQRLLIVSEIDTRTVRAYSLKSDGVTLAASDPFVLLQSDDRAFQPGLAIQGPDGAIYLADQGGRILRLSWSGTKDVPAIELARRSAALAEPAAKPIEDLLAAALDEKNAPPDRAAALAAACRQWDGEVLDACLKLLEQEHPDLQRLAADALGDHQPDDVPTQQRVADAMQNRLLVASLPARRSLYIALGKLGTKLETVPEWIFEATSVTPDVHANRWLFDGHVRAAEMPKGWATELLIGNLEVALFDPNPEPQERQRLKQFVVVTAECMRTRELAAFLERTIRDERDYFSKLDGPLQARLVAAWQNLRVDPPVRADAVAEWLAKHPAAAAEVQQGAGQTLAKLGTEKSEALILVARQVLAAKANATSRSDLAAALERHRVKGKPGEIDELAEALRKP